MLNNCTSHDYTFEKYDIKGIGFRIKGLRELNALSQSELSKKINLALELDGQTESITRQTLSKIEKGILPQNFSLKMMLAFCNIFECSLGFLLGETDIKTNVKETIMNSTGLSEKAIDHLSNYYYHGLIDFINSLLESCELQEISECYKKIDDFIGIKNITNEESSAIYIGEDGDTYFTQQIDIISKFASPDKYYQIKDDWVITKSPFIKEIEIQNATDIFKRLFKRLFRKL